MGVVANMIAKFGQTITVHPASAGEYDDFGNWEDSGGLPSYPITASVQPATGRDRELFPEGVRTEEVKKLYCQDELQTDSEDGKTKADELVIGTERYKVISCQKHAEGVLNHYKVFAQFLGDEDAA